MQRYLLTLLLSTLLLIPSTAWGVACFIPEWSATQPGVEVLAAVPAEGVLVLMAYPPEDFSGSFTPEEALAVITVEVTSADGMTMIPGTVEFEDQSGVLIWRADAPLAPDTDYNARFFFQNSLLEGGCGQGSDRELLFSFHTSGDAAPTPMSPALEASLGEWFEGVQLCCTAEGMVCDPQAGEICAVCGTSEFRSQAQLTLGWMNPSSSEQYYLVYDVSMILDDGSRELVQSFHGASIGATHQVSLRFSSEADEYCGVVDVRSLIDGSIAEGTPSCVPSSELQMTDPPPEGNFSCEMIVVGDTSSGMSSSGGDASSSSGMSSSGGGDASSSGMSSGGDVDEQRVEGGEESCSCQVRATGGGSQGGLAWGALAGLLALVGWRRRGVSPR